MIQGEFPEFYGLQIEGRLQSPLNDVTKTHTENLRSRCQEDRLRQPKPLESEGEVAERREPEREEARNLCTNFAQTSD